MSGIRFPLYLVLFECLVYCTNDLLLPAFPAIQECFHVGLSDKSMFMIHWLLGASCFHIFLGFVAERLGYRFVWLLGVGLLVAGLALSAVAHSVNLFYLGRFLQGVSVSAVFVVGYARFHECYETQEAVSHLAWMGAARLLPPALGSFLGVALLHQGLSWRSVYWILAAFVLLAGFLVTSYMPSKCLRVTMDRSIRYRDLAQNIDFMLPISMLSTLTAMAFLWLTHGPWIVIRVEHLSDHTFAWMQCLVFVGFGLGSLLLYLIQHRYPLKDWVYRGLLWVTLAVLALWLVNTIQPHNTLAHVLCISAMLAGFAVMRSPLQRLAINAIEGASAKKMAIMATMTRLVAIVVLWFSQVFSVSWYDLLCCFIIVLVMSWGLWYAYHKKSVA